MTIMNWHENGQVLITIVKYTKYIQKTMDVFLNYASMKSSIFCFPKFATTACRTSDEPYSNRWLYHSWNKSQPDDFHGAIMLSKINFSFCSNMLTYKKFWKIIVITSTDVLYIKLREKMHSKHMFSSNM